eukprot:NODE_218_length_12464_cov_0.653781.p12 type:complete len:106 gc:universal NODE_218_length_12464_cov_0.653781:6651-6334(-)
MSNEFENSFRNHLKLNGEWNKIQASLKQQAFQLLLQEHDPVDTDTSSELINSLIYEYLSFHGYVHTLSVFKSESGSQKQDPNVIAEHLNLSAADVPVLYQLTNKQ